jgi:hypothetical protein
MPVAQRLDAALVVATLRGGHETNDVVPTWRDDAEYASHRFDDLANLDL